MSDCENIGSECVVCGKTTTKNRKYCSNECYDKDN